MADAERRQNFGPRNFFLTFLDVHENSKGYDGNAISSQQNEVIKSLISPYGRGADSGVHCKPNSLHGTLGKQMFEFAMGELSCNKTKSSSVTNGSVCLSQQDNDETGNSGRFTVEECVSLQNIMKLESEFTHCRSHQTTSVETLFGSSENLSFELGRTTSKERHSCNCSPDIDVNCGRRAGAISEYFCCHNNKYSISNKNIDNENDDDCHENDDGGDDDNDYQDDDNKEDDGNDGDYYDDTANENDDHDHNNSYGLYFHDESKGSDKTLGAANESVQVARKTPILLHQPSTKVSVANTGNVANREEDRCHLLRHGTGTIECDTSFADDNLLEFCHSQAFCPEEPLYEASQQPAHTMVSKPNGMLLPLSLLKTHQQSATFLSGASMKLELSLLESLLLEPKDWHDENVDDLCLYGKLAVLFSNHCEAGTLAIQVTQILPVGLFNFIDGTVKPGKYSEVVTNKSLLKTEETTLALFIEKLECAFEKNVSSPEYASSTNPETSDSWTGKPVAWVITSPGLGVTLDRELKKNLAPIVEDSSFTKTGFDQHVNHLKRDLSTGNSDILKWRHLLMLVDEYRTTDDDIPLAEVYELQPGGHDQVVNFEIL